MSQPLRNVIGPQLKAIRTRKNLSQGQLARILQRRGMDVDRIAIGRIETGRRRVQDYEVFELAAVLKVPVQEFAPAQMPPLTGFYPVPDVPDQCHR